MSSFALLLGFLAVVVAIPGEEFNTTIRVECVKCTSGPMFYAVVMGGGTICRPFTPTNHVVIVEHYMLHSKDCWLPFVSDVYTSEQVLHLPPGALMQGQIKGGLLNKPKPRSPIRAARAPQLFPGLLAMALLANGTFMEWVIGTTSIATSPVKTRHL